MEDFAPVVISYEIYETSIRQNLSFGKKSGQVICFVRRHINLSFASGTIDKVILKTNENENDSK